MQRCKPPQTLSCRMAHECNADQPTWKSTILHFTIRTWMQNDSYAPKPLKSLNGRNPICGSKPKPKTVTMDLFSFPSRWFQPNPFVSFANKGTHDQEKPILVFIGEVDNISYTHWQVNMEHNYMQSFCILASALKLLNSALDLQERCFTLHHSFQSEQLYSPWLYSGILGVLTSCILLLL